MLAAGCTLVAVILAGCGDSGGGPTAPGPPAGDPTSITIVGTLGNQSFAPNPATVAQGTMLVWRNTDSEVHRIRFNDDELDTGNIAPGATSGPRPMPTNGANYHCTIHPEMVGSIRASAGEQPPPCEGPYC